MNILRKWRKDFSRNNRLGRYLLYGLGEIILVVIGILIALYLDNRNEIAKEKKRFDKVIESVKSDLQNDLVELSSIIPQYDHLDSLLVKIITTDFSSEYIDSINQDNIQNCDICVPLHAQFTPFRIKNDGYTMLKSFNELHTELQYSINNEILLFYKNSIDELALSEKMLAELASKNLYDLEAYHWYIPSLRGLYHKDAIDYFLGSIAYKNKIATFQIVAIGNYLNRLKTYQKKGKSLLEKLKK